MTTDLKSRPVAQRFAELCRVPFFLSLAGILLSPLSAKAAAIAPPLAPLLAVGWDWWLPPSYAAHGGAMDKLFIVIFWLTNVVFVGVQAVLIYFMVKYRHRPDKKKAIFVHGNTRLEMIWTLIPAVILIGVALWTKGVWENYRYNPNREDPTRAQILVIGQQFKWNVIYPGPDGKLGRYLIFPKVTDLTWPEVPEGKSFEFPKSPGPAYMPEIAARIALNQYIEQINPLGKDFSDPDGKDDDYQDALSRPLELPKGRLVDVNIGSKDVIHDFYLPNFRVKLDAVPGMRGHVYFTPTVSSAEFEAPTHKTYTLEDLDKAMVGERDWVIIIPPNAPNATREKRGARQWLYKDDDTIVRNGGTISPLPDPDSHKRAIDRLRAIGVTEVEAYRPQHWDLVCAQLCGMGHYTMQNNVVVLEDADYQAKWGPKPQTAATPDATTTGASTTPPETPVRPAAPPATTTSAPAPASPDTAPATAPSTEPANPSTAATSEPSTPPPATAPATAPGLPDTVPAPTTAPSTAPATPATRPTTEPAAPLPPPTTVPTTEPSPPTTLQAATAPTTEPTTEPTTAPGPASQPATEPGH